MSRVLIALAIAVVAAGAAYVMRRRRQPDAPSGGGGNRVPVQLNRADFDRPDAPWLVAAFTSATCDVCRDVTSKVDVLASDDVAVQAIEYPGAKALHQRYAIEAVPLVLIAGSDGVVVANFLGPITATDLWSAVATART